MQKKSQQSRKETSSIYKGSRTEKKFTYDEIKIAIDTLKSSDDYYKLVVCVLLATGRRSSEVIARGIFERSKITHHVLFSGQLKTGDEKREAYDIPVLGITPQSLIKLVEKSEE